MAECPDESIGHKLSIIPDHVLVVQPGQKFHLTCDFLVELFALWIQWYSLDGIKPTIKLVSNLEGKNKVHMKAHDSCITNIYKLTLSLSVYMYQYESCK